MIATAGNFAEQLLAEERQARESDRIESECKITNLHRENALLAHRVRELEADNRKKSQILARSFDADEIHRSIGESLCDRLTIACVGDEYEFSSAPVAAVDVTGDEMIATKFDYTHKWDDGAEEVELTFRLAHVAIDSRNRLMATYNVEFTL